MFDEDHSGVKIGSDLPDKPRIDGEPNDIAFVARVKKNGRTGPPEMVFVDQITKRKRLRIGEIEVIKSGVEPTRIVFGGWGGGRRG